MGVGRGVCGGEVLATHIWVRGGSLGLVLLLGAHQSNSQRRERRKIWGAPRVCVCSLGLGCCCLCNVMIFGGMLRSFVRGPQKAMIGFRLTQFSKQQPLV